MFFKEVEQNDEYDQIRKDSDVNIAP